MSNKERIGVILDVSADVGKIEGSLSSLRNHLSGIQLPKGIGKELETRMGKLSDEIKNFQNLASKAGNSFEGAKQIDASYKKILEYARKVENSFSAIKDEAKIDASKFFPKDVLDRIEKAEGAMTEYYKAIEKGNEALTKQRKELKDIESALDKNKKKQAELLAKQSGKKASRDAVVQEQTKVKTDKTVDLSKERESLEILNKRKIALEAEKAAVENLTKKREAYNKTMQTYSSKQTEEATNKISNASAAYAEAEEAAKQYGNTIRSISEIKIEQSNVANEINTTKAAVKSLGDEIAAADAKIKKADEGYNSLTQELKENEAAAESFEQQMSTLRTEIEQTENAARAQGLKTLAKTLEEIGIKVNPTVDSLEDIQNAINNLKPEAVQAMSTALEKAGVDVNELGINLDKVGDKNKVFQEGAQSARQMNNQVEQLKGQVQQFFSLTNSVMLFRRGVQQAIETIKELDAAMTETAVVTDFSVGDMWDALPRYTQTANELGTTTLGAYETMTLFYQQGLDTNEVFEIGTETMKMARIAGLEYTDATNLMTAALRGFNMELNETSAQRINDVYSELAAITAADTNEIATAMTKTASIADSANMEFETTAALLSQIIETTREPAETAGTAMKTIIARFTEMKKATSDLINVDGEEVSVNKVEDALKSAGVALRDVNGEFRDLDDVFLELSSKWNSLDMMTQRYVATMAAGSRQQSRFIAMMQDYERTMELVDAAYSSSGASQKQFEKTQDSLESKLNKLKNAWDEFLMGISNSKVIKAGVDALTGLLNVVNKLTGNSGLAKLLAAIVALKGGSAIFNKLFSHLLPFTKQLQNSEKVISLFSAKVKSLQRTGTILINVDSEGLARTHTLLDGFKSKFIEIETSTQSSSEKFALNFSEAIETIDTRLDSLKTDITEKFSRGLNYKSLEVEKEALETQRAQLILSEAISNEAEKQIMFETQQGILAKGITGDLTSEAAQSTLIERLSQSIANNFKEQASAASMTEEQLEDVTKEMVKQKLLQMGDGKDKDGKITPIDFSKKGISDYLKQVTGLKDGMGTVVKIGGKFTTTLGSIVSALGVILTIVAAIAALALAFYEASPFKKSKEDAEHYQTAIDNLSRSIENCQKKTEALGNILDIVNDTASFDNLIEGSTEWYLKIEETNKQLLEQIELLSQMGYEVKTSYNEDGLLQIDNLDEVRAEQVKSKRKETELQIQKMNTQDIADVLNTKVELEKNRMKDVGNSFITGSDAVYNTIDDKSTLYSEENKTLGPNDWKVIMGGLSASNETFYAPIDEVSEDYSRELEQTSKKSVSSIISRSFRDSDKSRAAQKVIQASDDVYETYFKDPNKALPAGYTIGEFANDELKYNNQSVTKGNFEDVIKGLGYVDNEGNADYYAVASQLGLLYDGTGKLDGFYTASEGSEERNYIDFSKHGQRDTDEEWLELMNNPDTKDVDLGYMTMLLAQGPAIANAITQDYSFDSASIADILYGSADYNTDYDHDNANIEKAVENANKEKQAIESNIVEIYKDSTGSITSNTEGLQDFVNNIYQIQQDFGEQSAQAYQTMVLATYSTADQGKKDLEEVAQRYREVFSGLDLSNPTEALEVLNQKVEEGVAGAEELREALTQSGQALDISTQFSELFTSGALDEISEEIAEISDEAGNIDVTATRELVDSNTELKNIMDAFNVSGYAMGKILTDIQKGELTLTEINEGLIESYKILYSAMGQAEDVLYDLRNADLGEDYTEIGSTYEERYKTAKDLYDRGAYGSENFAGNIKSLIGNEEWNTILDSSGNSNKKAYEKAVKKYHLDKNDGNLYGSFSAFTKTGQSSVFGMDSNGQITYDFTQEGIQTYDDVLTHMVDAFGISREYAKAMLADMATYSDTLQNDLNALNSIAIAQQEFDKMYFEKDDSGNTIGYTNKSDAELAEIYGSTKEWSTSEASAKEAMGQEKWNKMSDAERRKETTRQFKSDYNIQNTVKEEDGKEYKIENVDSFGNKYYKKNNKLTIADQDKQDVRKQSSIITQKDDPEKMHNGARTLNDQNYEYNGTDWKATGFGKKPDEKTTKQLNADAVQQKMSQSNTKSVDYQALAEEMQMEVADVQEGLQEIAMDPIMMQMATELNTEEYDAWLRANYGENAPEILMSAGFSQESLAAVEAAKNEMITQIQAVAEALGAVEVTIPIKMPPVETALQVGDLLSIPIALNELDTKLTIGGEGSEAKFTESHLNSIKTTSLPSPGKTFNANTQPKGTGYSKGHDETNNSGGGGGGGGSKEEENDTDPRNKNLDKKIDALDRKLERREIDAVEHQFAKDALYLEKKMALQAQKNAAEAEAEYLGKYYKYDAETDAYLYLEDAYNNASDETKNKIDEEIDKLQGINDELNEIEDAIEDFEFKNPYDEQQFYEAEGDKINTDNELAHIDRQRQENERYRELVGKMPSEVQGPLNLALTGADMFYESQEIGVNLERKAALEQQMRAKYNDSDFYGEYYTWNERTQSFDINSEALSNPDLKPETRDAIMEEFDEMQGFAKEWRDVSDELSGGFIQDAFKEAGEAAEDLAISFINEGHAADNINDIFDRFEKKLGLNENALDGFGNAIGDVIDSSELLDKTFKGFGIENVEEKINQSPIGGLLSENQKSLLSLIGGEGGTVGQLGASLGLNLSDMLGGIGNFLNFDMMSLGLDMFNGMMGMVDQGKQMIEKIIGYITQATQVIVDAWTNREDYLYNFLKIIEKHLQEYEKLQRRQTQLEKGRTSTVEEIRANYDAQWKSLQQQLEEQQERLETRQKELERSRWNPFSLISGWNPSSDALYENREVKFLWDLIIGLGEAFAPFGTGAFFTQLNQLYEDYDKRVQQSYEDRLEAEQALLDIEDERLELVKYGSEEATEFEQKVLDAMIKKEQEQIDELTRLNDAITDANSKLISTLQDNLDKMRQDRENEKKEEELSEKERRLAYLRQDTSGANMLEIKKLEEQLEEEHEDYTDTLIDQKISELEKQNELAAEQRQQQIDLLQSQLDYAEKYGLYWDAIYGMLYTIDENGNAVLNPENFDIDGNIRENSQLAQMLGTFSDRLGMSVWSAVLDNEEMKRLGRYYGFFIGNNGVTGNWRHQWALDDPGADDPNFAYPDQEIPEGLWGVLYRLEIGIKKYFANSDPDLIDRGGRMGQAFKNFFGKLFGNEEWANYKYEAVNAAHVQSTTFAGMKKLSDDTKEWFKSLFSSNESYGNKTSRNLTGNGAQNIGDINTTNYFQIGNVGETISLDEMVDRVAERFKDMFSIGNNVLGRSRT